MYQVFISYKSTDKNKNRTWDSIMGEQLYEMLEAQGIKTFFSEKTLAELGESQYQMAIHEALDEVVIFVAMCSNPEYLKSKWIAHEIECFHGDLLGGNKDVSVSAMYTFCEASVDAHSVPLPMRTMQVHYSIDKVVEAIQKRLAIKKVEKKVDDNEDTVMIFAPNGDEPSFYANKSALFSPGQRIDEFEVGACIGTGGFSEVYELFDLQNPLSHKVAKVYRDSILKSGVSKEKLMMESNILQEMQDRHFPRLYKKVDDEKQMFFIMDKVEGMNLGDYIAREEAVAVDKVLDWAEQLLEIMTALHEHKPAIIYRDFKPGHLILQEDGLLKLIDFGSARYYNEDGTDDELYLGTPGYAAPEQFGGMGQTDCRADYYGFGKTLFALLTGMSPRKLSNDADIYSLVKGISEPLACIIEKCTFADPEDRYQKLEDIKADFNHLDKVKRTIQKKTRQTELPDIVSVKDNQGNVSFVSEETAVLFAPEFTVPINKASVPITGVPVPITEVPGSRTEVPVFRKETVAYVCTSKGPIKSACDFIHIYVFSKTMEIDMFKYLIEHRDYDTISSVPLETVNDWAKVTISVSSKNMEFDRSEAEYIGTNELFHYACFMGSRIDDSEKAKVKISFVQEGKEILKMKIKL